MIGVVVGSFGMPSAVQLNVAAIRHFNGNNIPILVHDDSTPPARDPCGYFQQKHDFDFYSTPHQLGHIPGDISCFTTGLEWAERLGLKYLVKLSQRFLFTKRDWLAARSKESEEFGIITASQNNAIHGIRPWGYDGIRTECVMMRVQDWCRPAVFEALRAFPATPEHSIAEVARKHVHPHLPIARWRAFGPDKAVKRDGVLWHDANPDADYQALAVELGVNIPGYSSAGWNHLLGAKWKLF